MLFVLEDGLSLNSSFLSTLCVFTILHHCFRFSELPQHIPPPVFETLKSTQNASSIRSLKLLCKAVFNFSMENLGNGSFLRNRRLENCFSTVEESPRIQTKHARDCRPKQAEASFVEDNGWGAVLISTVRIVTCFVTMMLTTFIWALVMIVLIPWPCQRIKQGNVYGHLTGRLLIWILGNPIKIEGAENSNLRAIYISNHASPLDIFLIMWLTPTGSVGIAKKEIIWYPLFGQLYVLASHLRIDRSNPTAAIESMKEAAQAIVKNKLSLVMFPEGTRSKTGRLLPFKKGFIHMALQSRLPIVPMVLTGTHLAWRKGGLHVRPAPLTVKYLPPIRTDNWTSDKIDDYIKLVHSLYVDHLPELQKPLPSEENNMG